jgi:hypothetical protein
LEELSGRPTAISGAWEQSVGHVIAASFEGKKAIKSFLGVLNLPQNLCSMRDLIEQML